MNAKNATKKTLGVFALSMINVAAICGIRNLPTIAETGFATLFYMILAAVVFFIPACLICAELASGWPKEGGIFAWVKEAFGHRTGFLAIWLLWIENVIWYPTALTFIAGAIAYIFRPDLANNALFNIGVILIMFWASTFVNLLGMRSSSLISSIGVIFGTLLPGVVIIALGMGWFFSGNTLQIQFDTQSLLPDIASPTQLVIFSGILLSLLGIEMSSVHVKDVQHPGRDYPKSIFISIIVILAFYILGSLAIAIVVPQKQISLTSGSLQAFSAIVSAYGLSWLTPYMAFLVLIGAIGALSTWTIGPARGLLAAAKDGDLPPFFRKINHKGMPLSLLIAQAILVSFISVIFVLMPSVNSAYWILSVLVTQLYLVMYLLLFGAVIKLRYSQPNIHRPYKIPGGKLGVWIVGGVGLLSSLATIVIGFFPPAQIKTGSLFFYVGFLILGMIIVCFGPAIILLFKKPHWKHPLEHEK